MTSTASQQNPATAPNASAPSYASAAGAAKKPTSTPLIATGSNNAPVVATGSSVPTPQHAKSSSVSPVNGRPNIMPAVPTVSAAPAVAHGSSTVNGNSDAHARKPSVTMSANGPSSLAANGGAKNGIQFGFQDSPAQSHSQPQAGGSAPIAIPGGDPRITEPQHSPSPIPQPSASGGRPPSNAQQGPAMTFGSFGGGSEGDRMARQPSGSQPPNNLAHTQQHMRRESSHSMHNEPSNQGTPPQAGPGGRGGFPAQGGRGRGGYGSGQYNGPMGYPPNGYPRAPNQGRGGMAPNFTPRTQFGTPPQANRSPAPNHAMPHHAPNMPPNMAPTFYYPPPHVPPTQMPPQVKPPPRISPSFDYTSSFKGKKKGIRRDGEKFARYHNRPDSFSHVNMEEHNFRRSSKRVDQRFSSGSGQRRRSTATSESLKPATAGPLGQPQMFSFVPQPFPLPVPPPGQLDLSPESGNFERWLTSTKQQNFYQQQYDPMGRGMPMSNYPMYPQMQMPMPGQHSPAPQFNQPFMPNQFHPPPPGGQPMSRNNSQMSERPNSSTGQSQAPIAQGTPQTQAAQLNKQPAVVSSPQFTKPARKSAAIIIKNEKGEAVDFSHLKAPASPAPSSQQSKTPPAIAPSPTPPPKPSTPKATVPTHVRTDSAATNKTAEEVRNELKEKIAKQVAADGTKPKENEAAKAAEAAEQEKKEAEEKAKEEERVKAEKAEAEAKAKAAEEAKAKAAEEAKAKAAEEAKAKEVAAAAAAAAAAEEAAKAAEKPAAAEDEEDEIERQIREMEEAEAKRDAEEKAYAEKKAVADAARKKAEAEQRAANAADNDRKLREQEAEMERLEEEKERRRAEKDSAAKNSSVHDLLSGKVAEMSLEDKDSGASTPAETPKLAELNLSDKSAVPSAKPSPGERRAKPAALNLAPLNTTSVEPPQPSAALQSLKTSRLLTVRDQVAYPEGIFSPNPALNAAVAKKNKSFKYDPSFLLQFKAVFTEQPSMEFGQQVKSLIGDGDGGSRSASVRTPGGGSQRQNSNRGSGAVPAMGNFGAPGGRTLPPGTTSEQRMAMSSGSMPRPPMAGPMASFQRPGTAFPGPSSMSRTPSMGNMPQSPRQGSRSTRQMSKRDGMSSKAEAQAAKTMPLTAGMKIEALQTSTTGWKPPSISKSGPAAAAAPAAELMDPAMVQRKVKAALNKMTPENFEKISEQILQIAAQSKDETDGRSLRQVIQLTFEKATDEAHWASMYAKFCKRMLENMSSEIRDENIRDKNDNVVSGGALFRKYLLNRCQEEFERGWKTNLPEPPESDGKDRKPGEAAMLSEEYYIAAAAKRRGLGLVQFIGELYKLGMLTERIMHECVRKLVDYTGIPDEGEVESLSKLLRTIGANLDRTEKGPVMMDVYFQRIQTMMDLPDLPSRLKFMLLDVIDLRKSGWVSKEANKGPKTLDEVRAEAEAAAAQKAAEAARTKDRGPGGRPQMGRGDARQFSQGFPQPAPNQVGMDDLRRLKGAVSRTASQNVTLGPTSMFASRSNSGRRLGPGGSLSRGAEDSGASSRTGTPPNKEPQSTNAFSLLANMDSENPTSPPSTAASPAMSKATPDTTAAEK